MPRRTSGFDKPYGTLQISTWIVYPIFLLDFLLIRSVILFHVNPSLGATATGFYVCFAILVLYYVYKTCVTDPIDQQLELHLNPSCELDWKIPEEEQMKHCWVCQARVRPKSLHCKHCQKCVSKFDHHCQWLNTCIGERNYQYFCRTVVSVFCFVVLHLVVIVYLIVAYFFDYGNVKDVMDHETYLSFSSFLIVVTIIFGVILTITAGLVAQLLLFHIKLRREKITTYEYIVDYNKIRMKKVAERRDLNVRRATAKASAKQNNKSTFMIEMGKYACCIPFDPIRRDIRRKEAKVKEEAEAAKKREQEYDCEGQDKDDCVEHERTNNGHKSVTLAESGLNEESHSHIYNDNSINVEEEGEEVELEDR